MTDRFVYVHADLALEEEQSPRILTGILNDVGSRRVRG